MPTFRHGKGANFQLGNSSNVLQDLSSVVNAVDLPKKIDSSETTAFGLSAKTYIVGLQDATVKVDGMYDATTDAQIIGVIGAIDAGTISSVNWQYGPEGTTTGRVKYSGAGIITSYDVKSGVGDVVGFSLELQVTGAITRGAF